MHPAQAGQGGGAVTATIPYAEAVNPVPAKVPLSRQVGCQPVERDARVVGVQVKSDAELCIDFRIGAHAAFADSSEALNPVQHGLCALQRCRIVDGFHVDVPYQALLRHGAVLVISACHGTCDWTTL